MDVFDGSESLLPEFELDGGIELRETRVEMVLQGVRITEVDRMWLVLVFRNIGEMQPEGLTKSTELYFPLMLQAEFERLLCNLLHIPFRNRNVIINL